MNVIETYKNDRYCLKVIQDETPANPREDFDNLGTMIGFSRDYVMGDKHNYYSYRHFLECMAAEYGFKGWAENASDRTLASFLERHLIILPYYLYARDGLAIANGWDYDRDGFLRADGFLYVSKQAVREEWKVKRISPALRAQVLRVLKVEFETYEQYRQGEVYGFILHELKARDCLACGGEAGCEVCPEVEDEEIDSCWGFYGDDPKVNGMMDHLPEAARGLLG
ncbi:hypothetical protein [Anaeroselena agilis]|uniref:Uncharacterized protein n=1 Tax=Anaeroselena agilis TaxID=3063788 RepID=A0ABU3NWR8_9FIRM|nr:hypothetical protein [Selenomonadales bacterium 4137-cl]